MLYRVILCCFSVSYPALLWFVALGIFALCYARLPSVYHTMLSCYVTLRYVTLRYVMLCYVMLCFVMLCYVMLCYVMLHCLILFYYVAFRWYVILCHVMLSLNKQQYEYNIKMFCHRSCSLIPGLLPLPLCFLWNPSLGWPSTVGIQTPVNNCSDCFIVSCDVLWCVGLGFVCVMLYLCYTTLYQT